MKNNNPGWAEDRLDDLIDNIANLIKENQRPANEVILDDIEVLSILKICKRSLASIRAEGLLKFAKVKGKIYYKLSDVLELFEENRVNVSIPSSRLFREK